jgi:hypothetical protein
MRTPSHNHFAAAFCAYHEIANLNLRQIGAKSGISAGDLSRIRAGKKRVTFETLTKLCACIPSKQAAPLVAAFLKDHRPEGFENLVNVDLSFTPEKKRSRYQQAVHTLLQLEGNPALRRHLIGLAETLAHLLTRPSSK